MGYTKRLVAWNGLKSLVVDKKLQLHCGVLISSYLRNAWSAEFKAALPGSTAKAFYNPIKDKLLWGPQFTDNFTGYDYYFGKSF